MRGGGRNGEQNCQYNAHSSVLHNEKRLQRVMGIVHLGAVTFNCQHVAASAQIFLKILQGEIGVASRRDVSLDAIRKTAGAFHANAHYLSAIEVCDEAIGIVYHQANLGDHVSLLDIEITPDVHCRIASLHVGQDGSICVVAVTETSRADLPCPIIECERSPICNWMRTA